MSIFDRWFELEPQKLASGQIMQQWLRRDFYNGSITEIDGSVHAQWVTGEGNDATMTHASPSTVEEAMRIVESNVPVGIRRD